jgi:hypothetical protein
VIRCIHNTGVTINKTCKNLAKQQNTETGYKTSVQAISLEGIKAQEDLRSLGMKM